MRFVYIFILVLSPSLLFAQKTAIELKDNTTTKALKINGDSLKINPPELIDHSDANLIDSLWVARLRASSLDNDFQYVDPDEEISDTLNSELSTELLKERLAHLNSTTPFNVEYNSSLERLIKHYLKTRKKSLGILMGRAEYYFPMFEEHLDKYNIPLEIKYLAIVESALRPTARSRVGASGLWQFMYYTGKQFDLEVNSYVDERHDPIRATEAACKFLSQLYNTFNDWDLALAAYNSGPGNVSKAIRRSGGSRNYWNIRHNLPRETAGYLPAFYATLYLMEYADEHSIRPQKFITKRFETDTIVVKHQITFDEINKVLNTDNELLEHLNPQYKLKIIPFVKEKKYTLRLPVNLIGKFVSNEEQIYAYAKADLAKREKQLPKFQTASDKIRYRVRNGDYLGKIAKRYGVGVSQIKRWNGLRSNNLKIGQRLTIYPKNYKTASSKSKTTTTKKTATKSTPTGKYTTYTVKKGDSLWIISKKFPQVSVEQIKNWNNIWSVKSLKPGTKLKIYKS
uniref:lytic transglycosylase domain-containing protein n=1 Tax=Aureibaculum luteum TaxID=1548456 RepID=UPI003742389C